MQKFLSFILIVSFLSFYNLKAQNNLSNCSKAISTVEYSRLLSRLKVAPNDNERLGLTKMSIQNNCFTTAQVRELAGSFNDDNFRSEFVIEIHPKTINNQDFYEVYDSFMYFSSVLRLHDYFNSKENNLVTTVNTTNTSEIKNEAKVTPEKISFPKLRYPSVYQYNGERTCEKPIDDIAFMEIAQQVNVLKGKDFNQLTTATMANSSYCLSAEQTMKLSTLIPNEDFRLNYLSKVYPNVFDIGNMKEAVMLFAINENQAKWTSFINEKEIANKKEELKTAIVIKCEVNNDEFSSILESIHQIAFENTKINHTKNIIESKKCFTSAQIAQIMQQFSFERSMVEIAKFAYDYCVDTNNYFKLNNELTHASSKEELIKFTQSKKK